MPHTQETNNHRKESNGLLLLEKQTKKDPAQTVIDLAHNFGYPLEVYPDILTEDGYLLTLYRIPHGASNKGNGIKARPLVLIMHGFLASPLDYTLMGPKRSLGYILADAGYDVWLGNYRGSKHACKHKHLDSKVDKSYWNFSHHEIGVYDLPAMIKSIREITGCETLSLIGTSQGTASMFIMLSEKPQYNKMIKIFVCLAPVHNLTNLPSTPVHFLAVHPFVWKPLALSLGLFSFPTEIMIKIITYLANNYCRPEGIVQRIMTYLVFTVFGYSYKQLDKKEFPMLIKNIINPTSVKHYVHFSQNVISGQFRQFDFGPKENLKSYNQETPPVYDFRKITCPVAAFHSTGDLICGQKDYDDIMKQLPNVVLDHLVEEPTFSHLDFAFAVDVADLLYVHVQKVLDQYNKA